MALEIFISCSSKCKPHQKPFVWRTEDSVKLVCIQRKEATHWFIVFLNPTPHIADGHTGACSSSIEQKRKNLQYKADLQCYIAAYPYPYVMFFTHDIYIALENTNRCPKDYVWYDT